MEYPQFLVFHIKRILHYKRAIWQQIELILLQITDYFRNFIKKLNIRFSFLHYNIMIICY